MQQVKFFKGNEGELAKLEGEVNKWLQTSGVRVVQIFGNIAPQGAATELQAINSAQAAYTPSDVLLVVVYEKS